MPAKWKIFFALNIVLSLPAFVFAILLAIELFNSSIYFDNIIPYLMLAGLIFITFNGFLNIYVVQRFFPDKLIPVSVKRLNGFSLVMNMLTAIGLLLLGIHGAEAEFGDENSRSGSSSGQIAVYLLFLGLIIYIIVLLMQAQLPGIINRNNHYKIHSLIDSIGDDFSS